MFIRLFGWLCMCHITKITSVWRALVDLSKSSVCICSLRISGFAGFTALHLSNPAICICRQVISTLLLEQRWISPKKSFVFSKSNHLHFHSGDIHICQSLLFSSLLINQISPVYHLKRIVKFCNRFILQSTFAGTLHWQA